MRTAGGLRGQPAAIAVALAAAFLLAVAVLAGGLTLADRGDELARALHLHFGNPPRGLDVALLIARRNVALAAVPLAAAYLVPRARSWTMAADLFLIVVISAQVALVASAFAAYGARQARSVAPYAPLELLAFCLAAGVYIAVRRGDPPRRRLVVSGSAAIAGLLCAAVLEAGFGGIA